MNRMRVTFEGVVQEIEVSDEIFAKFKKVKEGYMTLTLTKDFDTRIGPRSLRLQSIMEQKRLAKARKEEQFTREEYLELAQEIADLYARNFLGMRKLDFKTRPKERSIFLESAKKVKDFSTKYDIPEELIMKGIMNVAIKNFQDKGNTVNPGLFSSKWMWETGLYQYLAIEMPGRLSKPKLKTAGKSSEHASESHGSDTHRNR
jgi:hypothetical protein